MMRWLAMLVLAMWTSVCAAHKPSDSYLSLTVTARGIDGQWDIALRDLDYAVGLDANADGDITWGELRAGHATLAAYVLPHLSLDLGGACALRPTAQLVDDHTDGAYAVLRFSADCPPARGPLTIRYSLFFDLDPQHRGLLRLDYLGHTQTAVFAPEHSTLSFDAVAPSPLRELVTYAREGVWHIWIGFDHILFLLSLLLPAVLRRESSAWRPMEGFRPALLDVIKVVTAFTVAHSLTLSLAALGIVNLPSRWVESAIAVSVILAALNNLHPVVDGRRWLMAFGFGLVHGLGFASVLRDLGLPQGSLLLALFGFNLGVEAGQLAIVGAFLPLAYTLRATQLYKRLALGLGSFVIVVLASVWLLERSLNLKIL